MGSKLYVGNLSYDVTSQDLETMFSAHGTVKSAELISDRERSVFDKSLFAKSRSPARASSRTASPRVPGAEDPSVTRSRSVARSPGLSM